MLQNTSTQYCTFHNMPTTSEREKNNTLLSSRDLTTCLRPRCDLIFKALNFVSNAIWTESKNISKQNFPHKHKRSKTVCNLKKILYNMVQREAQNLSALVESGQKVCTVSNANWEASGGHLGGWGFFYPLPHVYPQSPLWGYSNLCRLFSWHKSKQSM